MFWALGIHADFLLTGYFDIWKTFTGSIGSLTLLEISILDCLALHSYSRDYYKADLNNKKLLSVRKNPWKKYGNDWFGWSREMGLLLQNYRIRRNNVNLDVMDIGNWKLFVRDHRNCFVQMKYIFEEIKTWKSLKRRSEIYRKL